MEKNNGGAKPKTGNGIATNNNNSNSRQGGASASQGTGAQARNRSPRRENGYASRSNGVGTRGLRSNNRGTGPITASNNSNGSTAIASDTNSAAGNDMAAERRASVPNSIARSRMTYANQTRGNNNNNVPQRYNDYSPLRGQGRNISRQSIGAGTNSYSRPVMRHRNVGTRGHHAPSNIPPLEGPDGDIDPIHSLSAPASSAELSSVDPDSGSCSPTSPSPRESAGLPPPRSASLNQLSASHNRPMSTSRDALLARELLQSEMDMMLQQDEELARQIHEEMNTPTPAGGLALQRGMPFRQHFPVGQNRHDVGRRGQGPGRDRGFLHNLRLLRDADGSIRMGFENRRRRGEPDFPRSPMAEGRRASEPGSEASRPESVPESVFDDEESEPDLFGRRMMGADFDPPDDFLNMMNDPSLMLLMLLLRAPDQLMSGNEAGVDLEDYEGLWELAERIGEVRHRGISDDQISRLPTHKYKSQCEESEAAAASAESSSPQCQICLVDFENGDCLRIIPCKHDFHKDCIDEWLKRNATCPICRQDVKPRERT